MARQKTEKVDIKGFGNLYTNIPTSNYRSGDTVYITQAGTAEMIRQDIARMFPGRKYWVRSESYSGGDSIRVYLWNYPADDFKEVEKLEYRYKDGYFNGMDDSYSYQKKEEIFDTAGGPVDYGAKYIFVENRPPWDAKEKDMPVPDYSKSSPGKSSPKSSSSSSSKSRFKSKGSSKPHVIKDDTDWRLVVEMATGWDVYLTYRGGDNYRIALVFNYAVGKAVYDADKWGSLKKRLAEHNSMPKVVGDLLFIWSLSDKCFYVFENLGSGEISNFISSEQAHAAIMDGGIHPVDGIFEQFGYKIVRDYKLLAENTPWYKDTSKDEEFELLDEIDALKLLLDMETDEQTITELQEAIKTLEELYETLYR